MLHGIRKCLGNHSCTCLLVTLKGLKDLFNCADNVNECCAAACNDTLFNCRLSSIESILDTELLLLHLNLGSRTNLDNGNTACKLCKALGKLFLVKLRGCGFKSNLDLCNALGNSNLVTVAANDNGVFLANLNLSCATKLTESGVLKIKTKIAGNNLTACKGCDVNEHLLTSVTKAGCLNGNNGEGAAKLVKNESCKSLALNVLGNDKQLFARLNDLLKKGEKILNIRDLLICYKDKAIVESCLHLICIGCEIGRKVAAVKLHTLYYLAVCFSAS